MEQRTIESSDKKRLDELKRTRAAMDWEETPSLKVRKLCFWNVPRARGELR
jgi:hypothetical protein